MSIKLCLFVIHVRDCIPIVCMLFGFPPNLSRKIFSIMSKSQASIFFIMFYKILQIVIKIISNGWLSWSIYIYQLK